MVRSVLLRKLVAGLGTVLVVAVSVATMGTLPLRDLPRIAGGALGAAVLYVSVALATAIHRSYPARHDSPEDVRELFAEGPYELCRHPFYFFAMLAQISLPAALASLPGLVLSAALIPAWAALARIEEGELAEYWGERYLEYKRRTPFMIPRKKRRVPG